MSAQRNSKKLATLVAALGLMALAAVGGYAAASHNSGRLAETANLSAAQTSASSRTVTIYACLSSAGSLSRVSTAASAKCPAKSVRIHWSAQASKVVKSVPHPTPTSTQSTTPMPSATPTKAEGAPVASTPAATATATAAASTPVATATAPSTTSAPGPACVTSDNGGGCTYTYSGISGSGTTGNQTNVIQDIWNPISGATQTLTAFNPGDWSVSANMPASNKAVVSYPDAQQIYTTDSNQPNPLSGYSSITGSYAEAGPTGSADIYEAAYDIWANSGAQEIMIWVDNHGQRPSGSVVGSATIDGVGYQIWSNSGANSASTPISMVMDSTQTAGSVNILADLQWLESNGYMNAGSGVNQIDFGWEICSTGGVPATFSMSQYTLKATCTSGTGCTQ